MKITIKVEERGKRGTRRASSRSRTGFEAYLLVTQRSSLCGGALRDDTKNDSVADFRKFYPMNSILGDPGADSGDEGTQALDNSVI